MCRFILRNFQINHIFGGKRQYLSLVQSSYISSSTAILCWLYYSERQYHSETNTDHKLTDIKLGLLNFSLRRFLL